jgi:hypothetical protein
MNNDKDPGWFVQSALLKRTDIKPHEKLVMAIVESLERRHGCKCSNRYIAEQIGSTAGAVKKTIVGLRKRGILQPFTGQFGRPIVGNRLVTEKGTNSTLPPNKGTYSTPKGTYGDTDTESTSIPIRERAIKDHPDWQSALDFLTGRGFPEHKVREAYDLLWSENQACKSADPIRNLSGLLRVYLNNQTKGGRSAPPAPVSQFSRTY